MIDLILMIQPADQISAYRHYQRWQVDPHRSTGRPGGSLPICSIRRLSGTVFAICAAWISIGQRTGDSHKGQR